MYAVFYFLASVLKMLAINVYRFQERVVTVT